MALTATSTHSTFKAVRKHLSMNNPELIGCRDGMVILSLSRGL